jgi:hypothetical protein
MNQDENPPPIIIIMITRQREREGESNKTYFTLEMRTAASSLKKANSENCDLSKQKEEVSKGLEDGN